MKSEEEENKKYKGKEEGELEIQKSLASLPPMLGY